MKNKMINRAKKLMKGMIIEWVDVDIDKNITDPNMRFSHRNPINRIHARSIFTAGHKWIIYDAKLQWLIDYDVVFEYETGIDKHGNQIRYFGTFYDLNEFMIDQIKADQRRGDMSKFKHVEFRAECLDIKPVKEEIEEFETLQIIV